METRDKKRFGNKQQRKFHQSQRIKTFLLRWKHRRPELIPHPIHTEKNKSKCKSCLQRHTTDRSGKHLACCITGSQSRLANDDGTWLCCRSLACLRGGAEGGGTPDVDADRPNLQLTLGSVNKKERQKVSWVTFAGLRWFSVSLLVLLHVLGICRKLLMLAKNWWVIKYLHNNWLGKALYSQISSWGIIEQISGRAGLIPCTFYPI